MPSYYFHLHERGTVTVDEEGYDCRTVEAAYEHGLVAARALMCDELHRGTLCLNCHFEIRDQGGAVVAFLWFKDAVDITER